MTPLTAVAVAVAFVWLGVVIGISFIEAPIKFRAPGVTIPIGLGIGRLVFRVVNALEVALAVVALVATLIGTRMAVAPTVLALAVAVVLAIQLLAVRPALNRRSDAVLAGGSTETRSRAHLYYVGLEVVKAAGLIALGVVLLAG